MEITSVREILIRKYMEGNFEYFSNLVFREE